MQILQQKKNILKAGFDYIFLSPRMSVLSFTGAEISKMWPRYTTFIFTRTLWLKRNAKNNASFGEY